MLRSRFIFEDIVIKFGIGKNQTSISIKLLDEKLGQVKCQALVFLHAIRGCNTVSSFKNKGKMKAYDTMNALPDI